MSKCSPYAVAMSKLKQRFVITPLSKTRKVSQIEVPLQSIRIIRKSYIETEEHM